MLVACSWRSTLSHVVPRVAYLNDASVLLQPQVCLCARVTVTIQTVLLEQRSNLLPECFVGRLLGPRTPSRSACRTRQRQDQPHGRSGAVSAGDRARPCLVRRLHRRVVELR